MFAPSGDVKIELWPHDRVEERLCELCMLNHDVFAEQPWNQRWDLTRDGTDPSSNCFAYFRRFQSAQADFWVAIEPIQDRIVGFGVGLSLTPEWIEQLRFGPFGANDGDAYQAAIAVERNYRSNGLGSRLIQTRLDAARRRGASRAFMRTLKVAVNVQAMYSALGFTQVGELDVTLGGTVTRRVVMRSELQ